MGKLLNVLFFIGLLFILGCDKDEKKDCGCDSEFVFTIHDSNEQTGYLFKVTDHSNPNVPYTNYIIWFNEDNCGDCRHSFFICNDSLLLSQIEEVDELDYPGIEVVFSGEVKNLCKTPIGPADYIYNYITLTKIKEQ